MPSFRLSIIYYYNKGFLIPFIYRLNRYNTMFLSRRRLVLIGTAASIGIVIILLPVILTITLPDLNKISITIQKIELNGAPQQNRTTELNVFFSINNPTSQALTTSRIDYTLFANGNPLGDDTISYIDIPVNGRPQLLADRDTIIRDTIRVTTEDEDTHNSFINNNQTLNNIDWKVEGTAIIESGFSSSPKQFTSSW
ncbi:MAG: hypothetical protein M3162_05080 [Thermoproteota archaeon]|nr:hypothetical protein [Thermoproteota archaeon]